MPRRDACWPPRCWAGMTSFQGYARYVVASAGKPDPVGVALQENTFTSQRYDVATGDWTIRETWTSRSGYQYLPTHAPLALLAGVFLNCGPAGCGRAVHSAGGGSRAALRVGTVLAEPGAGTFARDLQVLGEGPKPFWMAAADASTSPALDVADVPAEFTFRAQEAREQMADQVVQWTAWLLRSNPTRWPRTSIRCCARR